MLTLGTFLKYDIDLKTHFGGVIGVIGMMPLDDNEIIKSQEALNFQRKTPILLFNGEKDWIFKPDIVSKSYEYFINTVYTGKYKENITIH